MNIKQYTVVVLLIILFSMLNSGMVHAQSDNITFVNDEREESANAYYGYLNDKIGSEITVAIKDVEVNITGQIIRIYDDGLIIQALFQDIFIPRSSIAYIKANTSKSKIGSNKSNSYDSVEDNEATE